MAFSCDRAAAQEFRKSLPVPDVVPPPAVATAAAMQLSNCSIEAMDINLEEAAATATVAIATTTTAAADNNSSCTHPLLPSAANVKVVNSLTKSDLNSRISNMPPALTIHQDKVMVEVMKAYIDSCYITILELSNNR
jgi:hypothetical protein